MTGLPPLPLPSPPFTFTTDADTFISPIELPRGFPEPPVMRSVNVIPFLNSPEPNLSANAPAR